MTIDKEGVSGLHAYAYDPSALALKLDGEKVHGFSCKMKYQLNVSTGGTDILVFLQATSPWAGKLKAKIGDLMVVDLSYGHDVPQGLKETASENFTGLVTDFQAMFGAEVPEVLVRISGSEHNISLLKAKHSDNKRRV